MTYKCALFDLDNTLLLKKPTIVETVFELASQHHPELRLETVEKAYAASELWQGQQIKRESETGQRMRDEEFFLNVLSVYQRFLPLNEVESSKLLEVLSRNYKKSYVSIPDATEILGRLKHAGLILGVVSNNHADVRQTLIDLKMDSYFDCIVISEEVHLFKPDPKIMELACEKLGVSCRDSIYIGDHPFDVLCAHSAHMAVAWFPPNRFFTIPPYIDMPEYTIHTLAELIDILV